MHAYSKSKLTNLGILDTFIPFCIRIQSAKIDNLDISIGVFLFEEYFISYFCIRIHKGGSACHQL